MLPDRWSEDGSDVVGNIAPDLESMKMLMPFVAPCVCRASTADLCPAVL